MNIKLCILLFVILSTLHCVNCCEEDCAKDYVEYLNDLFRVRRRNLTRAIWEYNTNVTHETKLSLLKEQERASRDSKEERLRLMKYRWKTFKDVDLRRQIELFILDVENVLPAGKFFELEKLVATMKEIYSKSRVCSYREPSNCNLNLEDIVEIFTVSRDPEELTHLWVKMRDGIGPNVRKYYVTYVDLLNEAATLHEMENAAIMWLHEFGGNATDITENLWLQLKPFYEQLHAYVRYHLRKVYGLDVITGSNIPAHLLGNPQAQTWEWISKICLPYKNRKMKLLTDMFLEWKDFGIDRYRKLENFLVSVNLTKMTETFWNKSIFVKPENDSNFLCFPTTFDFNDGEDFRLIHCSTSMNQSAMVWAPFLVANIEYFMQYSHQKPIYREAANTAFYGAFGDWVTMSFYNTHNLFRMGIVEEELHDKEDIINKLFFTAMTSVVFLPYSYVVGKWRWDVFSGDIKAEEYNCKYWEMVNNIQGIEPPVDRSEEDFDVASKYQIVANERYIKYFYGKVLGFQILRGLCITAGEYGNANPSKHLHDCDIYGKTEAGNALSKMLSLGRSKYWRDALEAVTGDREIDASAILEYYDPLLKWLKEENIRNNETIGWGPPNKICKSK